MGRRKKKKKELQEIIKYKILKFPKFVNILYSNFYQKMSFNFLKRSWKKREKRVDVWYDERARNMGWDVPPLFLL